MPALLPQTAAMQPRSLSTAATRTGSHRNAATIVARSHGHGLRQLNPQHPEQQPAALSRRLLLAAPVGLAALLPLGRPAAAFTPPPPGMRFHNDKLDGYSFFYPEDWTPVTTSGNDVFFRNPFNAEENLFVDVSSPSSSRYDSPADLGTPAQAARRILDQFLEEFMSTRIGARKAAEVVAAEARTAPDGALYYDIQTRVKSYASRNQLAVSQAEVDEGVELEWDRRFITVLGVSNNRLYSLRLQASDKAFARSPESFLGIARSFKCYQV